MDKEKKDTKKGMSSLTLFILAMVSYLLTYLIGGVFGDFMGFLGLILLALSIVNLFREQNQKARTKKVEREAKQGQ